LKTFFIILIFITTKSFSQKYASWSTGNEDYVRSYEVEISADKKIFVPVSTITPERKDTNYYSYLIPQTPGWIRIKANMNSGTYYTDALYLNINQPPTIFIKPENQTIQLL
jgi:hypothetical protein